MTDRALYIAMTGASASLRTQAAVSHNLANADTVGFQATLEGTAAAPINGQGHASRVAAASQAYGVSGMHGGIVNTGNTLDVALNQDRWLTVQDPQGGVAYTRAGNLSMSANGLLTSNGHPVLGADGAPLTVPPYQSMDIAEDGTISIVPQGQPASTIAEAGRLGVVQARTADLVRGDDGLMRPANGQPPAPATGSSLVAGAVENSNVEATSMLVQMIQTARAFEMQVRVLQSVDENARSANSLLSSR
ncbi:flagellar basal body rod protein FlgF [Lysobacter sp. LF1]|uniref:Flagellar basal-body rod protein FlgF n=1 Tax=Lysobacter stagni TaxID=3045172 RepID=A0ABT6XLB4_9GAMM|nr:flagellar basal body rod protein FlgF [Lysobacter sp. LF1]MDI9240848.1 flagellar basal body rod protein FlgF [Lysobacter sp. LF1]